LKKLVVLLVLVAAGAIGWGLLRQSRPPSVSFARVRRQPLVSTIPTNGKAEPFQWQAARAGIAGLAITVSVREGQSVAEGAELAVIGDPALQADIDAGEAKVAEARADLSAIETGGKPAELTEIENGLSRARLDLEREQREAASLQRLVEKQAATREEATAAQDKVRQSQLEIEGLGKRRASLVGQTDVAAAKARIDAAEAALKLARQRASQAVMRAPIAGVVYELTARPGEYLSVGALVANIGRTDRLRVRVYVDEPELGRVAEGDPVAITWDALPGKRWQGTVERKPARIQALGSRQVGEVACAIENPERELPLGANVNAEIRTAEAADALAIPKEALRRDSAGDYVFVLAGGHIERRPVRTGIASATLAQITQGLSADEAVALPADIPLKAGDLVTAVIK